MIIGLSGEEPFLLCGLRFAEPEDTSGVAIDLSKIRLADPLTALGVTLVAQRTALGGNAPHLVLPGDDAEIERLTVLGLFGSVEGAWLNGTRPRPNRVHAARCLPLRRLDAYGGGKADFASRCIDLVERHRPHPPDAPNPRMLRAIAQVLAEIVDNAIVHARSPAGTYGVARLYLADEVEGPAVEAAIGDAGVGIVGTLGALHPRLAEPVDALRAAFEPGVSGTPPGGLHCGLGLHLVDEIVHERLPGAELVILSDDACGWLKAGGSSDSFGPRSDGCPYARSQFGRWGTWARLRVPLET